MISNTLKQEIINNNKKLGLKTEFIIDNDVLGYSLNTTIYINENIDEQELEKINKHELLHFFTDTIEFKATKKYLFDKYKNEIEKYRKEYYLRYFGLYSDDEMENGVIDDEIAIDLIINNFQIEIENNLKVGNLLFDVIIQNVERKRYLNLNIKNNIANMNLSNWEKIFIVNYYDGVQHKMPIDDKYTIIRNDISKELERLYSLSKEDFIIHPTSPEVIREYESELKALSSRGENTSYLVNHKEYALKELASDFTEYLYEEYMHIVNFLKTNNQYEDAFKAVILRETLSKTYKKDKGNNKTNTIVKKRDMHNSISGHMILANDTILKTLYENINDYNNFANLYFTALELYINNTINKSEINLENVETFNKGRWIKFDGKHTNENEYIENSKKLAALVADTSWCTKSLASSQLAEGDFFVFVDHDSNPHIAVKMIGNEIDEVRGILNGNAQELEPEYRDVAISFLENNKKIKNGKEWLEKEEWNKRLIMYNEMIKNKTFTSELVPNLIEDYFKTDYKSHGSENTNKQRLEKNLPNIIDKISKYYNCTPEEIYLGDYDGKTYKVINGIKTCPYVLIFGVADFRESQVIHLGKLQSIGGSAYFSDSQVRDLGKLQSIGGDVYFRESQVTNLSNLQSIGGYADFFNSQVRDLGNLQSIGGDVNFSDSQVRDLGNLQSIGGDVYFSASQIRNLGKLQSIGGNVYFRESQITDLGKLQSIGGSADFSDSQVRDLESLQSIGGYADFFNSQVRDLGNLQSIGRDVNFSASQIRDLGKLQSIGGRVNFASFEQQQIYEREFENGKRIINRNKSR